MSAETIIIITTTIIIITIIIIIINIIIMVIGIVIVIGIVVVSSIVIVSVVVVIIIIIVMASCGGIPPFLALHVSAADRPPLRSIFRRHTALACIYAVVVIDIIIILSHLCSRSRLGP